MPDFESVEQTLKERADDEKEVLRRRKRETLSQKISRFLDGEMSANESDSFSLDHAAEIDAEIRRRERAAAKEKAQAEDRATAFWEDGLKPTPEEDAADRAAIEEFCRNHPEFKRGIAANGNLVLAELRANRQLVTLENLEAAYRRLKPTGAFVEKTEEEKAVEKMSANEFKRSRPELQETGVPPLVEKSILRTLGTLVANHPEFVLSDKNKDRIVAEWDRRGGPVITVETLEEIYRHLSGNGELELKRSAVAQYGRTRIVDYGDKKQHGVPPQPSKYSFRQKVASMSAAEYAERCANDPQFRESLDNLEP